MKRPIFVLAIGYIIGILWGLYCKFSIAFLYLIIFLIAFIIKKNKKSKHRFKLISFSRYSRYLKIILKLDVIIFIIISSFSSNIYLNYLNKKSESFYLNDSKNLEAIASVVSNKEEKENNYVYKIKIKELNINLFMYISKENKFDFEYGDQIIIKGMYKKPDSFKNYNGFNYTNYLKQKNIYGYIYVSDANIILKKSNSDILKFANLCFFKIKENIQKYYFDDEKDVLLGLTIGYTNEMNESVKENFRISNISHILAVSGMHINFIIIGILYILNIIVGKRMAKIITCIFLIMYMLIIGFSPSVVRACIMGCMMLLADILYRKNDFWSSISFSALILLIFNPYLIQNVSFQFSFGGTIGIVLFYKTLLSFFSKIKFIPKLIKEIFSVTVSAQIIIFPISVLKYNIVGISFFITNIVVGIIICPIIILSFIQLILPFKIIVLEWLLQILIIISEFGSKLPLSKIYVSTPNINFIIVYYCIVLILNQAYNIKIAKNKNATQIRIKNLYNLVKYRININKKKIIFVLICLILIFIAIKLMPKDLQIYFIDVGQGDSCLIKTPCGRNILIDGGEDNNILLPYLLDRGVTKLDYVIITHFDSDHCRWII